MGPNSCQVLYVHINQTLSKVIYFLFDEDFIVIIILLFYLI